MAYQYTLHPKGDAPNMQHYRRGELERMTTYQLREICQREKLVLGTVHPLDRDSLVRLILRFRGEADPLWITRNCEGGFERVETMLLRARLIPLAAPGATAPAKLTVFKGLGLAPEDGCIVTLPDAQEPGNALLVSEDNRLCALFVLMPTHEDGRYWLTQSSELSAKSSERKNYSLLVFEKTDSEAIYSLFRGERQGVPQQLRCRKLPILDFELRDPVKTSATLAIDFGTTNTVVGFYADQALSARVGSPYGFPILDADAINLVHPDASDTPLIPTAVSVEAIEGQAVRYRFGNAALSLLHSSYEDERDTLFCDIKRWVSDAERTEEIIDRQGNRAFVSRKAILQAYLQFVVGLARQRFKCDFAQLHITCPVKQKYRFAQLFAELLPGYGIDAETMLDEGTAVLYHTISKLIDAEQYEPKRRYKALVVDCGGGTTDLSSCAFEIENRRISYKIDIDVGYENGDTEFGGNNLTYRIMQLVKIAWAQRLTEGAFDREPIIGKLEGDVLRMVDEEGAHALYAELEDAYARAESILPTMFKRYESRHRDEYFRVKTNFYFLFDTAERVKKMFFSLRQPMGVRLASGQTATRGEELGICTLGLERWKLSVQRNGTLSTEKDVPELLLSAFDLRALLRADIYAILSKLLTPMYEQDRLYEYSIIKLTGQSCKIDVFREVLKEFVPGKVIRFSRAATEDGLELKLACLQGAITYLNAKTSGYADVSMRVLLAELPYSVIAYTHTGAEKTLIHCKDAERTEGFISRHMERLVLKLYLRDSENRLRCEYQFVNNPEDFRPVTYEEIMEIHKERIIQDETDNIIQDEVKFFVFAKQALWGFAVVPVYRHDEQLYLGKQAFFPFENDAWENNLFDGTK